MANAARSCGLRCISGLLYGLRHTTRKIVRVAPHIFALRRTLRAEGLGKEVEESNGKKEA